MKLPEFIKIFQCPVCSNILKYLDSKLECPGCGEFYKVIDGIPVFSRNKDYYYGEIPKEDMDSYIKSVRINGWEQSFRDITRLMKPKYRTYLKQYVDSASRAGWKYLLRIPCQDEFILDFGCGWGNISISLARSFGSVLSTDLTFERSRILKYRTEDALINNIGCIVCGDTKRLPFQNNTFSAVILNGVLEWVPTTIKGDPRRIQEDLLKEIYRILKKDGQLYIGIENRMSYGYFLGRPEEHTKLKFISLLPRSVAKIYANLTKLKNFRTYTYSYIGYKNLLKKAEFNKIEFYYPYPEYREFDRLIDLSSVNMIQDSIRPLKRYRKAILSFLAKTGLIKYICPSYSIIASKEEGVKSFVHELIPSILESLQLQDYSYSIKKIFISSSDVFHIFLSCREKDIFKNLIIGIPLTERANFRCSMQYHNLLIIQNLNVPRSLKDLIPVSLKNGKFQKENWYLQTALDGTPFIKFINHDNIIPFIIKDAFAFGAKIFFSNMKEVVIDENLFKLYFGGVIDFVQSNCYPLNSNYTNNLKEFLYRTLIGKRIKLGFYHGDYSPQNILIDENKYSLKGIIDWDCSQEYGLPLMDAFHLLVTLRFERFNLSINRAFLDALKSLRDADTIESKFLEDYITALELPYETIKAIFIIYLFYQIKTKLVFGNKDIDSIVDSLESDIDFVLNFDVFPKSCSVGRKSEKHLKIAVLSSGLEHIARGVETWAKDLGYALKEKGIEVTLYKGSGINRNGFEKSISCIRSDSKLSKKLLKILPSFSWRFGLGSDFQMQETTFTLNLLPKLMIKRFDIIHTQDPDVANILRIAKRLGLIKSKVILAHGTEEPFEFIKKFDYLQHLAPYHMEEAIRYGVNGARQFVIPNFVDTERFGLLRRFAPRNDNESFRNWLGIPNDAFVVLCVAAIKKHHKRIDYLIEEIAELCGTERGTNAENKIFLVIAGSKTGETQELIEIGKRKLEGKVKFLTDFPRERMSEIYAMADLFVLCSLKEMMSIAILEALASDVPCIVNKYPVMEWVIGEGGECIDMTKEGELAKTIEKYKDEGYRKEKGLKAREQVVKNFSKEIVVEQIIEMYREVLQCNR